MKYLPVIAVALISAILLAACAPSVQKSPSPTPAASATASPIAADASSTPGTAAFQAITPAEAKKRLDTEQGIILLDVRTAEEYATGHIKNSVLLPVDNIAAEAEAMLADKDAVIFIYCRSGRRSAIAAEQLVKMGYTKVYDLGGIIDWPYEVVKG